MRTPEFLVLAGDGINCERETARAVEMAGGRGTLVHVNDLIERPKLLEDKQGFILPGGFSFGDELGSGRILSYKLLHYLGEELENFKSKDLPILGICNGFQVLVKMGWLPGEVKGLEKSRASLIANRDGKFWNRWMDVNIDTRLCLWTPAEKTPARMTLPVRNGEGRFILPFSTDSQEFEVFRESGQLVFEYSTSSAEIAGVCNERGNILGLMPHPEAACSDLLLPSGMRGGREALGLTLFQNAVSFLNS